MSILRRTVIVGAALCTAVTLSAAPALATTPATSAIVLGVKINASDPTKAIVEAKYRCTGTPDKVGLWVSVKQDATASKNPALREEGSSSIATAWSQSHANVPTCDSKFHVQNFIVGQNEQGFGALQPGYGYVQFCLFDAPHQLQPVSSMLFRPVVG